MKFITRNALKKKELLTKETKPNHENLNEMRVEITYEMQHQEFNERQHENLNEMKVEITGKMQQQELKELQH
jgi:hypothetical protein